jgi:hypothetical protein
MPLFRRRRPLLRAAAVGGGAYAFGKHRQRKGILTDDEFTKQKASILGL